MATDITDRGLKELNSLQRLQALYLIRTKVTGVKELGDCKQLQILSLRATEVADDGLVHLKQLENLKRLELGRTKVTDEGLKPLSGLLRLENLDLEETEVTDEGIKELRELKELQTLDLSKTKVTDEGMKELKGLNKLTYLNIARTQVTDAGINEIEQALPGLVVVQHLLFPFFGFEHPILDFEYKRLEFPDLWKDLPGWLKWLLGPAGLAFLGHLLKGLLREPSTHESGKSASPRPGNGELGLGRDGKDGVWRRKVYPW
jgi:hypothetical protein